MKTDCPHHIVGTMHYHFILLFCLIASCNNSIGQEIKQEPREIRDIDIRSPKPTPLFKLVPIVANDDKQKFKLVPSQLLIKLGADVKQDDILLSVNGIVVSDETRLKRALRRLVKVEALELEVLREGKIVNVSIPPK